MMRRPVADIALCRTREKTPGSQGSTEEVNHQTIVWLINGHF